jgi:hypothetical protein
MRVLGFQKAKGKETRATGPPKGAPDTAGSAVDLREVLNTGTETIQITKDTSNLFAPSSFKALIRCSLFFFVQSAGNTECSQSRSQESPDQLQTGNNASLTDTYRVDFVQQ